MIYIIISSISILSMLVFMGWFVNDALKFIEEETIHKDIVSNQESESL